VYDIGLRVISTYFITKKAIFALGILHTKPI